METYREATMPKIEPSLIEEVKTISKEVAENNVRLMQKKYTSPKNQQKLLNICTKLIKEAAKKGMFQVSYCGGIQYFRWLPWRAKWNEDAATALKQQLKTLGFKIEITNKLICLGFAVCHNPSITISWK